MLFDLPVASLKRGLQWGGAVHRKVLENGKRGRGNQNVGTMWDSNGIKLVFDNQLYGAAISKVGVKIVVLGAKDVKSQQTSPNIWKVNAQKEQNCSRHQLLQHSVAQTTTAYNKEHPMVTQAQPFRSGPT